MRRLAWILSLMLAAAVCADAQTWGDIEYKGTPWVENTSRPFSIDNGLNGRHIALWASHGRYYDNEKGYWKWQRPYLFGTTEDLFTQTIVVPYLIPMLERAGAVVFTPRERDWQPNEVIVDNDNAATGYVETTGRHKWVTTDSAGFAQKKRIYRDGDNPFKEGTARMAECQKSSKKSSSIAYQPRLPESGRYAVYVSYQTLPNSIDDARYTVVHQGVSTTFRVNQTMGGGTWVYLGTFDFDGGSSASNRVVLTNESERDGVVSADAVRFGGGMGNFERGDSLFAVSGVMRALEGARYSAQWAGMPPEVWNSKGGVSDYGDDINARSLMSNYLGGGSCFMPDSAGLRVPIELSVALHSDAGYDRNGGDSIVGSLAICTTNHNDGKLAAGISRQVSYRFASNLLNNITTDLTSEFGRWNKRYLWDRNYSETRLPNMPSAILEMLSHQNFNDVRLAQDPHFKFSVARSVYKTVARYISAMHNAGEPTIAPLAPTTFSITLKGNKARLRWLATADANEKSAAPTGYVVYTKRGDNVGFDNGTVVRHATASIELEPNTLYSFRVTAINSGGESFPTEQLSAYYNPDAKAQVLIINGFERLAAPQVVDNDSLQGFRFDIDPGVSYGRTLGWAGRQLVFDKRMAGIEDSTGLGFTDNSLEGKIIAGNTFDYVSCHAEAMSKSGKYSISSTSVNAVERKRVTLKDYDAVDLILGLQRDDGYSLRKYKTFSLTLRQLLQTYISDGGALLASGAYIGTDMATDEERQFLGTTLCCRHTGIEGNGWQGRVEGLGMQFDIYSTLCGEHYSATSADILEPVSPAFAAMKYADNRCAAVASSAAGHKLFVVGFPLECIKEKQARTNIINGILKFLIP